MQRNQYKFERYEDRDFPVHIKRPQTRPLRVCPHHHEDVEFFRVLCGSIRLIAGTKTYYLEEGDLAFIPPFTFHEAFGRDEGSVMDALVFHPGILGEELRFTMQKGDCHIFKKGEKDTEIWWHFMNQAAQLFDQKGKTYAFQMRACLLQIGAKLIEDGFAEPEEEKTSFLRIQPALDYIAENYARPIALEELAELLCVCRDHFIRLFKVATQRTPAAYITDFRVTEAMKLLSGEDFSVGEIAEKTGFPNTAYFNRVFKQKMQMTPLQYRKKARQ